MSKSAEDARYMAMALRLAESASLDARPNPRVGCVVVTPSGEIVGRGKTHAVGGPHAEADALAQAGGRAKGATAYVTLEPCNHQGRTPPCSQSLIDAGIKRVVCAARDASEKAGGGLETLRKAGVDIEVGLMVASAQRINPGFHRRIRGGLPWVRLKMAATQDGRTALEDGRSQWITGGAARRDGHLWRARSDAVVTGSETVIADNPQLTIRHLREIPRQPLRVVVDRRGRLADKSAKIFDDQAETLWLHGDRWSPQSVLEQLARLDCNEVLLEAGPTLSAAWLEAGLVDEVIFYQNPSLLGTGRNLIALGEPEQLDDRLRLDVTDRRFFGPDCRIIARPLSRPRTS